MRGGRQTPHLMRHEVAEKREALEANGAGSCADFGPFSGH